MFEDSFVALTRRGAPRQRLVILGVLLAIVFAFSIAAVELRLPGSATAPWWPAAGVAVVAVLASGGRGFAVAALVLVVTTGANLVVGTVWWMALGFGVANAAEAWIVATAMRFRRTRTGKFGRADIVPFLVGAAVGGTVIGLLAGLMVQLSGSSLADTAAHVAASHTSAVLLLAALAVLPRSSFTIDRPAVLAAQLLVLAGTVAFAFGPEQRFPLAFLPLPALAWAAFRFGSGIVLVEIGLTAIAILSLSLGGHGPFVDAAEGDAGLLIGLVQIYIASLIVSMIPLAVVQDGRTRLYSRLSAREQLLRGVIVNAHAGFVVVRRDDRAFRVVESNPTGMRLLAPWLHETAGGWTVDRAEISALLPPGPDRDWTGERELPGGILVELVVAMVPTDRDLFVVQAIDATRQRAAARALGDALEQERAAGARLQDLAVQKDQFVSSISHELRTPVTSILGYAEELAESPLDDDDRHYVDVILRNSRRLARLVDDLLSLSRSEAGAALPVDLAAVLEGSREEFTRLAEAAGVTLELRSPDGLVVTGDPLWIDRVVTNLVTNAVKFTPSGGSVTVSAAPGGPGMVRLEVADTGRGIPPEHLEEVFERFYRVSDSQRGFVPGTGLGLPIARDLVSRMGGTLTLNSDGRTGTTAVVELLAAADPSADPGAESVVAGSPGLTG